MRAAVANGTEGGFYTDDVKVPTSLCTHRPFDRPLEATLRVQGPGEFLITVFLFWDGGVAYRGAAGIGAPLVPAAGRDEPRKTAKCGKRLKNGLLAIF